MFVVEYISRQGMAASSQWMVISAPWMSMQRDLIKPRPMIISERSMLRSTTCSDWFINLLACSSEKLNLVSVLVLVARTPAPVDHCPSCLVFFTGSLSDFALFRIDSLAPELARALTSWVLNFMSFLPSGMTSLTNIIGLKCMCFSFLLDLVFYHYQLAFAEFLIVEHHVMIYPSY